MVTFVVAAFMVIILPHHVRGDCSSVSLKQTWTVNETAEDIVLMNVTLSAGTSWVSTPLVAGVSQASASDLNNYIRLQYNDTWVALYLEKALDKEELYKQFQKDVEKIILKLECSSGSSPIITNVTVVITALDEYSPTFEDGPYKVTMKENEAVDYVVLTVNVTDADVPEDRPFIYSLSSSGSQNSGSAYIGLPNGINPQIVLQHPVDYDELILNGTEPIFHFVVNVTDGSGNGRTSSTNVTVVVEDVDDQPPAFWYEGCEFKCASTPYNIFTTPSFRGKLEVHPVQILAQDQDSLNFTVEYSIVSDPTEFDKSFNINAETGELSQTMDVHKTGILMIKAQEISTQKRFSLAPVLVEFTNSSCYPTKPESSTNSDNNLIIGLIVMGVVIGILIVLITVLIILHRKLRKQTLVRPFDEKGIPAPNTSRPNGNLTKTSEVKPIIRNENEKKEDNVSKQEAESDTSSLNNDKNDEKVVDSPNENKNGDNKLNHEFNIENFPTPQQRKITLTPISESDTVKKKKKKKRSVLKKETGNHDVIAVEGNFVEEDKINIF